MRKFRYLSILLTILVCGACEKPHLPLCRLAVTPQEGTLHTFFLISAESCSDSGNPNYSLKFRWDINGDGTWETGFTTDREFAWKYTTTGIYMVKMEATDPDGNAVQLEAQVEVTNKNQAPVPYLKVSLAKAGITTPVLLDGSLSFDYEEYYDFLRYRWDFNSDGIWDTGFSSSPTCIYQFDEPATYTISLQVMDSDSATAKTTKTITILNTANLYSSLLDVRNNKVYPTVLIGKQWWMAENLDYGEVKTGTDVCSDNGVPEMYVYQDLFTNHKLYGGLYTWGEAVAYNVSDRVRGICPDGWHIPTDADWKELELAMGMSPDQLDSDAANRGDPVGALLRTNGTSGLEAGLFGFWSPAVGYFGLESETRFWSSSYYGSGAWCRMLKRGSDGVQRLVQPKDNAFAIRCIQDE